MLRLHNHAQHCARTLCRSPKSCPSSTGSSSSAPRFTQHRTVFWTEFKPKRTARAVVSDWQSSASRVLHQLQEQVDSATGLAKVEQAQRDIQQRQDSVNKLRIDVRRQQRELEEVLTSLNSVRSQLEPISARDPRYLALTTKLVELLEKEAACAAGVKQAEEAERMAYTLLTQLIVESHMLERTSTDRMKAWGLVLSIAGTIVGFLSSSLMYRRRQREIKTLIAQTDQSIGCLAPQLDEINSSVAGQQSKWDELKTTMLAMLEEQTDAIARLLLQQKLGELLSDDAPGGASGSPEFGSRTLSEEQALKLGGRISEEVSRHVHHILHQHMCKMQDEFDAVKSQVSTNSERVVETAAATAGGPVPESASGGSGSTDSTAPTTALSRDVTLSQKLEQSENMFLELLAISIGLALIVTLHSVAGI